MVKTPFPFRPVAGYAFLEPVEFSETGGPIQLLTAQTANRPDMGKVLASGGPKPGEVDFPMVGDTVLVHREAGVRFKYAGKDYWMVENGSVRAVVSDLVPLKELRSL